MPISWKQLTTTLDPEAFTVETVTGRGAADPWRDYWTARQKISQKSFGAIRRLAA